MIALAAALLTAIARLVLRLALRGEDREYLRGDLEEALLRRQRRDGELTAALWFLAQALRSVARRRASRARMTEWRLRRDRAASGWLTSVFQDLRFALRVLAKQRGFTAGAVLMLALGVGATTAMFTFVNGLLLRPLPYAEGERLVELQEATRGGGTHLVDYFNYRDWRERTRSFSAMAAYYTTSFNASLEDEPFRVSGVFADDRLLEVLGVEPALGRGLLPGESGPGGEAVVVIADSFWRSSFAADPQVVGRTLRLQGRPYRIVGVMPPGFHFREYAELWVPHLFDAAENRRGSYHWRVLARLAPGVDLETARAEMWAVGRELAREHEGGDVGQSATATPLREAIIGDAASHALTFLGFVVLVQLIATLNVGNLLLARALGRRREMAVRTAIGAGRGRLVRQLVTESLVLAAAGGVGGVALGLRGRTMILDAVPAEIPRWFDFSFDWRVAAFSLGVTAVTGVVFGLLPALYASRDVSGSLKEGGDREGNRTPRLRSWLVSSEVAMAMVLLVGAGLMLRGAARTRAVDPGLDSRGVLTFSLSLPAAEYGPTERVVFYEDALRRMAGLPGVREAAAISYLPLSNSAAMMSLEVEGLELAPGQRARSVVFSVVSGDYFEALRVPIVDGRALAAGAGDDERSVAVVSDSVAASYWPGESAVGGRIRLGARGEEAPWLTVIGVAAGVRHFGLDQDPVDTVYVPLRQSAQTRMSLLVRTDGDPRALAGEVRELVRQIEPDVPIFDMRAMDTVVDDSLWLSRLYSWMFGVFAGIALSLAAVGLYGLVAYSVSRQSRDIGVRLALGAEPARMLALVVRQALRRVLVGICVGTLGAVLLSRLLASMVFGMRLWEPGVYLAVAGALLLVALLATLLPGRRAARVDPLVALRSD